MDKNYHVTTTIYSCLNGQEEPIPKGGPVDKAELIEDHLKEFVWNQLSKEAREEIIGSWENAKVKKVALQNYTFHESGKYAGKELFRVSFDSQHNAVLGPVTVYVVDPQTQKIVGYEYRD